MQTIITEKQDLLTKEGLIKNPGFAFTPVWNYNRENIKAPKWRIKEWDYYLVTSRDYAVAFTISDLAYLGMISVSLLDLKNLKDRTKTMLTALPMGKFNLPRVSNAGVSEYNGKDVQIRVDVVNGKRHLTCRVPNFDNGATFEADLQLTDIYDDTMNIATPWAEKPTCFYYNQKINCIEAEGNVTLGDEVFEFKKGRDYAVLDWGRGVWTYDNTWFWGTGSGVQNGKTFGFNLGYGFSDRSSASENVIFYDGKGYKLSEVIWDIPKDANGKYEFMKEWTITSDDNAITGTFKPILDRNALTDVKIIVTDQHQVFGNFSGTVVLDGEKVEIKDFLCALEVVRNKY
ncbi:MAG: DUF2804 domain-containing protein [Erysipelotrichales bacterium]|nr:DUF2804 domain-containing protein [Erysipelotrichales bacterium]